MSPRNRFKDLSGALLLSLAVAAPAVLMPLEPAGAADDSYFFGIVTRTPMVHVPMPDVASYAQLVQQLEAQGYANIKVTPLFPNLFDPRPELIHPDLTFTSPGDKVAQATPVHWGWNGTAEKNGRTFEVYVVRAPG
jgi:hypothetical protein